MPRMLGRSGYLGRYRDEVLVGAKGPARKVKHRVQRQRENDVVRQEAGRWRFPGRFDVDSLDDPSDCAHGCNGDCERHGSEVCTFLCHPVAARERVEQWAERTGHCDPSGAPDELVVRAHLNTWAASAVR